MLAVRPLLILFFFYFLHKDGVRGKGLWPDSLKLIFQCSSLEEKVDVTWIMFSTLGISNPQQRPSKFPDISEMLKTIFFGQIYFCPKISLHRPGGDSFPC